MDFWDDCDEVERVPGKVGGRPVVKGTRIEPETVLVEQEYGRTPEQTHASFLRCRVETIRAIQAYARSRKHQYGQLQAY